MKIAADGAAYKLEMIFNFKIKIKIKKRIWLKKTIQKIVIYKLT